jgi:stage V sporulation protein R
MKKKLLSTTSEWTIERIQRYDREIGRIAKSYQLETYPNKIEIITAEQMLDVYSSIGMPMNYHHWSFGKKFLDAEKEYRSGKSGLAYEMVINSTPCLAYLLEENTMVTQAMVIAHACYGHNSFFKNNYLFQLWTHAESIIDYLYFAQHYIQSCEERYGISRVEELLDACHALMNYGVDKYRRPSPLSMQKEKARQKERADYLQSQVNELWRVTLKERIHKKIEKNPEQFPQEPQENILYFIEKNAPLLESWQREIIRIVRKIAQYFYPQRQTKMMNEGWATFWHYEIIQKLYDEKLVNDQFMLEFLQLHTNVIVQPPFYHPAYNGINPYTLGFKIFSDIRQKSGDQWVEAVNFAMRNYKDESFIGQYLSPEIIRDMHLFAILDDDRQSELEVSAIHNEEGYQRVREALSRQYNLSEQEPDIQVYNVNQRSDRSLVLRYIPNKNRPLSEDTPVVLNYLRTLWGFPVTLETVDKQGNVVSTLAC